MKTWNFGIVGAGLIADFHARAIGDLPNAKLIGCCDKIADRAKQLADKYDVRAFEDYEQMIRSDEIDIVTIATPSGVHMEPAVDVNDLGGGELEVTPHACGDGAGEGPERPGHLGRCGLSLT